MKPGYSKIQPLLDRFEQRTGIKLVAGYANEGYLLEDEETGKTYFYRTSPAKLCIYLEGMLDAVDLLNKKPNRLLNGILPDKRDGFDQLVDDLNEIFRQEDKFDPDWAKASKSR